MVRLFVKSTGVLTIAHPESLKHFKNQRVIKDRAEKLLATEKDFDETIFLKVMLLEKNEKECLIFLYSIYDLLCFFQKRLRHGSELIVLEMAVIYESVKHQADGTHRIHSIGIDLFIF